ncbi:rCG63646 [Rattus norvegicus]|uniref:RCG63646 n=1 Tax=Rattus norvegicus TaxID=10116 RepID=A6HZS9_RAT|nr:rCG63646 [Rattus norvegicus]
MGGTYGIHKVKNETKLNIKKKVHDSRRNEGQK